MKENGRVAEKRPENQKENGSYRVRTVDFSQPSNSFADRVMFLQRTIGNNAVERLIRSGTLQAKFRNGRSGDKYEQEADRVAGQVMRMPEPHVIQKTFPGAIVQRDLAATPARARSRLPSDVVNAWADLNASNNGRGALMIIVQAMERRGEIDTRLMQTQPLPGRQVCAGTSPYILDGSVQGAFTSSCGCFGPDGDRKPNPRIRIHPNLVSREGIGGGAPLQRNAEMLHSTLLHEYRHVQQTYEECNRPGVRARGVCTDCNGPDEMDAYLSEIEAGYSRGPIRHAWVRIFVNWDFLAPEQQRVFAARRDSARRKVESRFPGVNWQRDPDVLATQRWCNSLAGGSRGTCNSSLAPLEVP